MVDDDVARRRAGSIQALRALSHPIRLRMCSVLAGGPSSAAQLARALDLQHARASYHLRVLRDAGLVALLEQRTVNGGIERRYQMVEPPEEPVGDQPATTEDWVALVSTVGAILQQRAMRVSTAPKWFVDLEVWTSPDAMDRARRGLEEVLRELRATAVDPAAAGASRVSASALVFSMREED